LITDFKERNLDTIDSKCDVLRQPIDRLIATVPFLSDCVLIEEMETRMSASAIEIAAITPIPSSVMI
jgi:hypothetical protein